MGVSSALLLLWACSSSTGQLEGRVVDLFAQPVRAEVSLVGLAHRAHADEQGRYRLPFVPGRFLVRYAAPGKLPLEVSWELFGATQVQADDVVLVPIPPELGLWRPLKGAYDRLLPVEPQVDTTPSLGQLAPSRRLVRVQGEPTPVCAGEPLIVALQAPSSQVPLSAWKPGARGLLWIEGLSRQEAHPAELKAVPLDDRHWRLELQSPGPVVLVPEINAMGLAGDTLYYLELKECP